MNMPNLTTTSLILAGTAIVATSSTADAGATHERTVEIDVQHVEHAPVRVDSRNGSIVIRAYDGDAVRVVATLKSKSETRIDTAMVYAERHEDDRLDIGIQWPTKKWKGGDSCSFEVLVPNASGVHADTSNGSITIEGLTGAAKADTSNGSITIRGHHTAVHADSSNGSITVLEASGAVHADTSNGAIHVALTDDNPGPVSLDTSNGSIDLEVGPAFVGTLKADTSLGRVSFGPIPDTMKADVVRHEKTEGRIVFGDRAKPVSRLDTSIGSISVKARPGAERF